MRSVPSALSSLFGILKFINSFTYLWQIAPTLLESSPERWNSISLIIT